MIKATTKGKDKWKTLPVRTGTTENRKKLSNLSN
jgi:hypothetical protein